MRLIITLLLLIISLRIHAQSNEVYEFQDPDLTIKPTPTTDFVNWLKNNNQKLGVKAPYSSKKETKVILVFIVDENGKIQDPKIWRGIGQGYDEYAYHLIKNNPYGWNSGKTDGGNVKSEVYYQLDFIKNKNSIRNQENGPVK